MGQLRTRKRGNKWEYNFEGATVAGKRKTISKSGFRTKAEAITAGTQAMNEYYNFGQTFSPTGISIFDYLDYWFDIHCKLNLKYNTQLGYIQLIENHLKPTFGHYKLKSLTAASVQEYINQLRIRGLARSSVIGILSVLNTAYEYAIEPLGYVKENPCQRVKMPRFEREAKERYIIQPDEFRRIIGKCSKTRRHSI